MGLLAIVILVYTFWLFCRFPSKNFCCWKTRYHTCSSIAIVWYFGFSFKSSIVKRIFKEITYPKHEGWFISYASHCRDHWCDPVSLVCNLTIHAENIMMLLNMHYFHVFNRLLFPVYASKYVHPLKDMFAGNALMDRKSLFNFWHGLFLHTKTFSNKNFPQQRAGNHLVANRSMADSPIHRHVWGWTRILRVGCRWIKQWDTLL